MIICHKTTYATTLESCGVETFIISSILPIFSINLTIAFLYLILASCPFLNQSFPYHSRFNNPFLQCLSSNIFSTKSFAPRAASQSLPAYLKGLAKSCFHQTMTAKSSLGDSGYCIWYQPRGVSTRAPTQAAWLYIA